MLISLRLPSVPRDHAPMSGSHLALEKAASCALRLRVGVAKHPGGVAC